MIFENKKLKINNLYIESNIKKGKVEEEIFLFKKLNNPKNYIKLISDYFIKSDFNANLVLVLNISDDYFKKIENSFFINFLEKKITFKKIDFKKVGQIKKKLKTNLRYMEITARKDSLIYTINNRLPFEDLLIGFQIQVLRKPNLYNTDFWHHFTNVYIDGSFFKNDKLCGSCEALNQQLY